MNSYTLHYGDHHSLILLLSIILTILLQCLVVQSMYILYSFLFAVNMHYNRFNLMSQCGYYCYLFPLYLRFSQLFLASLIFVLWG